MEHAIWEQAVQRVANSQTLRHRAALRHLFLYLAGRTLAGGAGELKEYVIGVEACAKPASYDPQTDASVRVQVGRLRQCLMDYYQKEHPEDTVRIEIPKGQFQLVFGLRVQDEAAATPLPIAVLQRRLSRMIRISAVLATIAVAATVGLVFNWKFHGSQSGSQAPELRTLWEEYLDGDRPVLIVLGAPLFAKYTTSDTGVFFRDPRLNEWGQAAVSPDVLKVQTAVGGVQVTPSRIYTGVGEATGAFLLSRLLSGSKREVSLRRSHGLSWEDFKNHNVIVLGAPKVNLHLNHLPVQQQFEFSRGSIRNLRPRQGEAEIFDPKFAAGFEELEEDHALFSRFPGLHGIGETTVLAGQSTEATLAAVEFATQPRYAAELATRLRDAKGRMPLGFQVVLRARFKSQTPVEIHYVTHRLLDAEQVAVAIPRARP